MKMDVITDSRVTEGEDPAISESLTSPDNNNGLTTLPKISEPESKILPIMDSSSNPDIRIQNLTTINEPNGVVLEKETLFNPLISPNISEPAPDPIFNDIKKENLSDSGVKIKNISHQVPKTSDNIEIEEASVSIHKEDILNNECSTLNKEVIPKILSNEVTNLPISIDTVKDDLIEPTKLKPEKQNFTSEPGQSVVVSIAGEVKETKIQKQPERTAVTIRLLPDSPSEVEDTRTLKQNSSEDDDSLNFNLSKKKKSSLAGRSDVDQIIRQRDEADPSHKLRSLCKKGNADELESFLNDNCSDIDINEISEEGWTCLHEVITHDCQFREVARILVKFGASVNTQDVNGDSPLHSTLAYHNLENAQLLLDHGANLSLVNFVGRMPIHAANDFDSLSILLNKDSAQINFLDRIGNTPLHFAAVSKDRDRITLLLSRGASPDTQNSLGSTALHLSTGDSELCSLLLESGKVDIPDLNGNTPLHIAVRGRHKESAKLLITRGFDPKRPNESGKTPLNLAKDKEMKRILNSKDSSSTPVLKKSSKKPCFEGSSVVIVNGTNSGSELTPSILKKKRPISEEGESASERKKPRLTFNDIVDYSNFEQAGKEKRVKIPPIYIEPQFSSDED